MNPKYILEPNEPIASQNAIKCETKCPCHTIKITFRWDRKTSISNRLRHTYAGADIKKNGTSQTVFYCHCCFLSVFPNYMFRKKNCHCDEVKTNAVKK